MKRTIILSIILALLCPQLYLYAQTPAFPGAEGHGRYATGGRGGNVVKVTTLEDNAAGQAIINGSLRWAFQQASPKTIVFDVSGTIELKQQLKTGKDNITLAGQTAPGDGICISGYDFVINSNNIIIRFVRFRPGDESGAEPDGLGGMDKKNIIIDHCSVSWSVDECLSVYGMENLTVQWCIASEALRVSTHGKGTHGYGGNWGGNKASYHHNLIAHCESRTPRLGPRTTTQTNEYVDIRNNVFYNWAGEGCYGGEGMKVNMVNNYYKPGPATDAASAAVKYRIAKIGIRTDSYIATYPAFAPMLHVWGKFYIDGNKMEGNTEVTNDNWTKGVYAQQSNGTGVDNLWTQTTMDTIRLAQPLETGIVTTHTPDKAYELVLVYVGCSMNRDDVDARIISDVRNRKATYTASGNKAGYINTPFDTKPANAPAGWTPWLPAGQTSAPVDSDGDGIPDAWEDAHGLNKNNPADGKLPNAEGYTNLEVYLNSLVAEITENQNREGQSGLNPVEKSRKEITCYVDAFSKILTVNAGERLGTIDIFSVSGQKVYSTFSANSEATIPLSFLPAGIYVLRVVLGDNFTVYTTKICR
ncbi:MAG: T9SS type A sorting domain-containing protein [Dysgonamonadaceae bacterium]|nr:T9SS type A sorting domain-containing protein [Dysgonamonadaceae bacterium]